jgi:hypothetical protein
MNPDSPLHIRAAEMIDVLVRAHLIFDKQAPIQCFREIAEELRANRPGCRIWTAPRPQPTEPGWYYAREADDSALTQQGIHPVYVDDQYGHLTVSYQTGTDDLDAYVWFGPVPQIVDVKL